jgi:dimethylargininase
MRLAITREVSAQIGRCELSYLDRRPIDVPLAREQHRRYEECLASLGCTVQRLPEEPTLPDSVFVEDTAVVLDELAVITRPGAESRRPEIASVANALRRHRRLVFIQAPATLDGGDVLVLDRHLYVGISQRSNEEAVEQLRDLLADTDYGITGVVVRDCLHLKSAVTQASHRTLLINRDWVDGTVFDSMELIEVDPAEPSAANGLRIGGELIFPTAFPATMRRLEAHGVKVRPLNVSELMKAEGGVTCCSLIL